MSLLLLNLEFLTLLAAENGNTPKGQCHLPKVQESICPGRETEELTKKKRQSVEGNWGEIRYKRIVSLRDWLSHSIRVSSLNSKTFPLSSTVKPGTH